MNIKHGLSRKCGVYLLTCMKNGKRYVGASVDLGSRITQHFGKTCISKYSKINDLYADIALYGRNGFNVRVLEFCEPYEKLIKEKEWYYKLNPEYNMVEPDECPFRHAEVREKSKQACQSASACINRKKSHSTPEYKALCRQIQSHRMVRCTAITETNKCYSFESLTDAANWLNRKSALQSVITHIKDAAKRNGTAYGYRWVVG